MCQETTGGRPVCSCPPGHSGNPLTYCRRAECTTHSDCRGNQACRDGNCINPCTGVCGQNANCEVSFLLISEFPKTKYFFFENYRQEIMYQFVHVLHIILEIHFLIVVKLIHVSPM